MPADHKALVEQLFALATRTSGQEKEGSKHVDVAQHKPYSFAHTRPGAMFEFDVKLVEKGLPQTSRYDTPEKRRKEAFEQVIEIWKDRRLWQASWEDQPGFLWRHETIDHVFKWLKESCSHLELTEEQGVLYRVWERAITHQGEAPGPAGAKDAEVARPVQQFSLHLKWKLESSQSIPDSCENAYLWVKEQWKQRGIWHEEWSALPSDEWPMGDDFESITQCFLRNEALAEWWKRQPQTNAQRNTPADYSLRLV